MTEKIKLGDTVLVTRLPNDGEEFAWDNVWVGSMDSAVGREMTVVKVDESQGYDLDDGSDDVCCGYGYPCEVLQLVKRGE